MQYRLVSALAAGVLVANVNGLPIAQPEVRPISFLAKRHFPPFS